VYIAASTAVMTTNAAAAAAAVISTRNVIMSTIVQGVLIVWIWMYDVMVAGCVIIVSVVYVLIVICVLSAEHME
jgi:hypothetical protein